MSKRRCSMLGYAYAKQNDKADAVAALQKATAIGGPYQAPANDMLAKVNAGAPAKKKVVGDRTITRRVVPGPGSLSQQDVWECRYFLTRASASS